MNRENFKKEKKIIFFYCVLYSFICEVISLFVLGFDSEFATGIVAGTLCVILNTIFLELVVDLAIFMKKVTLAFLLQMGRFLIFGAVGYVCYTIGTNGLIGFAIGVLGIVIGAVLTYRKEETNG